MFRNSDPGILPVLVLTSPHSPAARVVSARQESERLPRRVDVSFVAGHGPDDPVLDDLYDPVANRRRTNRPLSRGEIAAYATHRKAWRALVDSGAPHGLVLEDDFGIRDPDGLAVAIARADELLSGRDIVKLYDFPRNGRQDYAAIRDVGPFRLGKWRYPSAGTVAYLISRGGAQKLLQRRSVFRPVDEDLKYFWELDLDVWSMIEPPVVEIGAEVGGSTLDAGRKAAKSRKTFDRLRGNLILLSWRINCYWRNRDAG
jgi:GR25 family glycosyltransferase involved in LPS biosynthesis